jgi:hypothetical protein
MNLQRSKWEKIGIHRSHRNGVRRWLGSKSGREIFQRKADEEIKKLKEELCLKANA